MGPPTERPGKFGVPTTPVAKRQVLRNFHYPPPLHETNSLSLQRMARIQDEQVLFPVQVDLAQGR